jgi:hypothetical protein
MSRRFLASQDLALWRARLAKWRGTGLSLSDYTRKEGYRLDQAQWWAWYLGGKVGDEPEVADDESAVAEAYQEWGEEVAAVLATAPQELTAEPAGAHATSEADDRARLEEAVLIAEELRRREFANSSWRYIPEFPTPKQKEFLECSATEVLFGGSAGGGKSSAILQAALQFVHVPYYSAIILRRTYADLSRAGAIMDRADRWLRGTDAKWNSLKKEWTFPNGAKLAFGYIDTEKDKYNYQGAEYQFVGIDEVTQMPESWYLYMFSRIRKPANMPVPLRMRATANPGGIGHVWVKRRFIDGVVRPDEERPIFIPSRLEDNPHINVKEYEKSLSKLDEVTRRQLRDGIWVQDNSTLVFRYVDSNMGIDEAPECEFYCLGADYGFTDSSAFVVLGWNSGSSVVYVVESHKFPKMTPSDAAEYVEALDKTYKFSKMVGDAGGMGKAYVEEARQRFGLAIDPAEKQKKSAFIRFLVGDMERGGIKFVRGRNDALIEEMSELPWRDDRQLPEDGFEDHLCDALLYGWRTTTAYTHRDGPEEEKPEPGSDAYYEREEERMLEAIERSIGQEKRPYWEVDNGPFYDAEYWRTYV